MAELTKDEAVKHLGNLLARLHRDGGHYQTKYGTKKAAEDADSIILALRVVWEGARQIEGIKEHPSCLPKEFCPLCEIKHGLERLELVEGVSD